VYALEHNIPLLVTLGLPPSSGAEPSIDPELKEQAILLRSTLPALQGEQVQALRQHVEAGDARNLPWNNRDGARKYKFRVRVASRVCWNGGGRPQDAALTDHCDSRTSCLPVAQGCQKTLRLRHSLPRPCTRPFRH